MTIWQKIKIAIYAWMSGIGFVVGIAEIVSLNIVKGIFDIFLSGVLFLITIALTIALMDYE